MRRFSEQAAADNLTYANNREKLKEKYDEECELCCSDMYRQCANCNRCKVQSVYESLDYSFYLDERRRASRDIKKVKG